MQNLSNPFGQHNLQINMCSVLSLFCHSAWKLYRTRSPHLQGHLMTAAVFIVTIKETPCILWNTVVWFPRWSARVLNNQCNT